jgi:hypothetical protein
MADLTCPFGATHDLLASALIPMCSSPKPWQRRWTAGSALSAEEVHARLYGFDTGLDVPAYNRSIPWTDVLATDFTLDELGASPSRDECPPLDCPFTYKSVLAKGTRTVRVDDWPYFVAVPRGRKIPIDEQKVPALSIATVLVAASTYLLLRCCSLTPSTADSVCSVFSVCRSLYIVHSSLLDTNTFAHCAILHLLFFSYHTGARLNGARCARGQRDPVHPRR